MTPQEALEFYKSFLALIPANPYKEAAECSIVALEKQIPKKPNYKIEELMRFCPNCDYPLPLFFKFCNHCGQALDWGKNND